MARKKFPTLPIAKKASPGIARPPAAKPLLNARANAHPQLVHGFLVRLPLASTRSNQQVKPAFVVEANVKRRPQRRADVRHEGPADDATFH